MSDTPTPEGGHRAKKRRAVPLVWAGSLLGATLLVLGVSGTLSSWTSAIITNDTNTAGTTTAVALSETDGTTTCDTVNSGGNQVTCAINKYSGFMAFTPDNPAPTGTANSKTVDVTFKNTGSGNAATFNLAADACTNTVNLSTTTGTLCADGHLTITVNCTDGATYGTTVYADLVVPATKPSSLTSYTHTATIKPGDQMTCRFITAVDSTTPVSDSGASISQTLTWTLKA